MQNLLFEENSAMHTISPTALIGNRYALHELLGQGGMGMVYRAQDRLTGAIVALKQVTTSPLNMHFSSLSTGGDPRLALAREFRTLASLRHPHIISVLDYGFDSVGQPYYTMEFLDDAHNFL